MILSQEVRNKNRIYSPKIQNNGVPQAINPKHGRFETIDISTKEGHEAITPNIGFSEHAHVGTEGKSRGRGAY